MVTGVAKEKTLDGSIASLAPLIQPQVESVRGKNGDLVYNATVAVASHSAQ